MKRILVFACALGLSAPMAFADCAYHQTNAKADVDTTTTTASISEKSTPASDEVVLLKKNDTAAEQPQPAE